MANMGSGCDDDDDVEDDEGVVFWSLLLLLVVKAQWCINIAIQANQDDPI
jgi:hypothetical protein